MLRSLLLFAALTAATAVTAQDPVLSEIVIEGNTKTHRSVVERIIDLEPGAPLPLEVVDQVWDRLEDCGYFAFVDLDTEEDDQGNATLLVSVEEDKTFRGTPYIRYDRRHKYLLGLSVRDINLGGRGEILELKALAYRTQRLQATWTKLWLAGRDDLTLHLDAQYEQGGFVWRPFDYAQWHALADLRWNLTPALDLVLGGGLEGFDQKDSYQWRRDADLYTFAAATRTVPVVKAALQLDTRDNTHYPEAGFFGELEYRRRDGDLASGQNSIKADLRGFVPLPGKPILALRALGHALDSVGAPEYVHRWGGPETVRGAPYAGREGDTAYLLTAEVRYPIAIKAVSTTGESVGVGLHAFMDVGDAWFEEESPFVTSGAVVGRPNRAWQSFGVGAHLSLLSWQLRFEAAKERDHDWTFEFMDVFNF